VPAAWEAVLAKHKLLVVAAHNSGNPRNIFDRIRMAVDANVGMRHHYKIDGARVYVSGFSGGARVASMLGVAFADLFTGMTPFMGVNFYTDLTGADGQSFGTSYIPDDEVLAIAKARCRYVLVTGEKDFNRSNTRAAYDGGFRKEGFKSVLYLEVPGVGHGLPDGKYLDEALTFLGTGRS
jgi:predicted peptidase